MKSHSEMLPPTQGSYQFFSVSLCVCVSVCVFVAFLSLSGFSRSRTIPTRWICLAARQGQLASLTDRTITPVAPYVIITSVSDRLQPRETHSLPICSMWNLRVDDSGAVVQRRQTNAAKTVQGGKRSEPDTWAEHCGNRRQLRMQKKNPYIVSFRQNFYLVLYNFKSWKAFDTHSKTFFWNISMQNRSSAQMKLRNSRKRRLVLCDDVWRRCQVFSFGCVCVWVAGLLGLGSSEMERGESCERDSWVT